MADEQEMQRKATEFRMLQERGAAMQGQLNALKNLIDEAENASKALEAIAQQDESASVLFPLGAGVIVKAKPLTPQKVLVEQGSGVVLEKDSKDALKQLDSRREKLAQTFTAYQMELNKITDRLEMLRSEIMQYR